MRSPPYSELEKLLAQKGFELSEPYFVSREIHRPFRRGDDEVDCFSDGGSSDVAFRVRGHSLIVSHLSHSVLATLIRDHPEILRGAFEHLISAESEAMNRAHSARSQS